MPTTYFLTTPDPLGITGQATWTSGAGLSSVVVNRYNADFGSGLATPIPGSDTNAQGFDYFATIPAGVLQAGSTIQMTFVIAANVNNVGVDAYRWGVEIGGVQSLSGVVTPMNAGSYVSTQAAVCGGAVNYITPPPGLDVVMVTGLVTVDSTPTQSAFFALSGIDPSLPLPVKLAWEWQAGTSAFSNAFLLAYGVTVTNPTP